MTARVLVMAIAGGLLSGSAAGQRVLTVRMHPSLVASGTRILEEYRKARKDVRVEVVTTSNADVLLGPRSFINRTSGARLFASDKLIVVTPKESTRVQKFSHLGLTLKLATPAAKTLEGSLIDGILDRARAAYGRDWWTNARRNTTVSAVTSAEAVQMVEDGKADAAIVLSSTKTENVQALRIPPELGASVDHFAYGRSDSLSQDLVEFFFSKGNQQRLVADGFSSPTAPVGEINVTYPNSMTKFFTGALGAMGQGVVTTTNESGKQTQYKGTALAGLLTGKGSQVRFISADSTVLSISLTSIRSRGGILAPMGDGNFRVILPGRPISKSLRWLRKIEVK